MVRVLALLFGIFFIAMGVMGFMPNFMTDGMLFGMFEVKDMHNVFHIIVGVLALLAAMSAYYSKLYFKLLGLIFAVLAVVGYVNHGDLMMMHVNMADTVLLAVVAVIALLVGFILRI